MCVLFVESGLRETYARNSAVLDYVGSLRAKFSVPYLGEDLGCVLGFVDISHPAAVERLP